MRNQSPAQFSDFPVFTDTLTKPVYSLISSIRCLSTGISASCVGLLNRQDHSWDPWPNLCYIHTHTSCLRFDWLLLYRHADRLYTHTFTHHALQLSCSIFESPHCRECRISVSAIHGYVPVRQSQRHFPIYTIRSNSTSIKIFKGAL